jgi:hypothetical protein
MKARDFEYRHQTLLHYVVVGLAVSMYLFTRDDIVWAAVRNHANSAILEQISFGAGSVLLLGCAFLETWGDAWRSVRSLLVSRLLFMLVVGMLVPLAGTIVIDAGEGLLVWRLFARDRDSRQLKEPSEARWGPAWRRAASKWGFAATMIVFTVTLKDRIAEIGAAVSFVVWLVLNSSRVARLWSS